MQKPINRHQRRAMEATKRAWVKKNKSKVIRQLRKVPLEKFIEASQATAEATHAEVQPVPMGEDHG